MSYRFGLVFHQHLLRELLREYLVRSAGAAEVKEFTSIDDLLKAPQALNGLDLLVIGPDGSATDPVPALSKLARRAPTMKVALVTDSTGGYFAAVAPQLGLRGIIHKRDRLQSLGPAIDALLAGGIWQSANVDHAQRINFLRVLSVRETKVIRMIALCRSVDDIARRLRVSPATVVTHRKNCMRKLGIRTGHGLLAFAWRSGLVSVDQLIAARRGLN
jgi:DNA-binding NarL/FixJ family response regulator